MGPQEREKGGVESLQEVSWPRGLLSPKGTCLSGGLALAGSLPRFRRDLGNPLTPRNATSSGETPASGVATVKSPIGLLLGTSAFPAASPGVAFPGRRCPSPTANTTGGDKNWSAGVDRSCFSRCFSGAPAAAALEGGQRSFVPGTGGHSEAWPACWEWRPRGGSGLHIRTELALTGGLG